MKRKLTKWKDLKTHHQVIFAIIIGFAVVLFWRGAWGIVDMYILPNNIELSMWVSLFIGIIILTATHYTTKELM